MTNQQIISRYTLFLQQNKSPNTIRSYVKLAENLSQLGELISLTQDDLLIWRNSLIGSDSTIRQRIAVCKSFFDYLQNNAQLRTDNPSKILSNPMKERSDEEFVYDMMETDKYKEIYNSYIEMKYKVLIALGNMSGLRIGEASNLMVEHIDFENKTIKVVKGKGNKTAKIPMSNYLKDMILKYMDQYNIHEGYLLRNRSGNHITEKSLNEQFNKIKQRFDIGSEIKFHSNRHKFISTLASSPNVSIQTIKDAARHSNIRTTQRYMHRNDSVMQSQVLSVMDNLF